MAKKDSPLKNAQVMTTIAVHDLENADDFYGTILGLERLEQNSEGVVFRGGGGAIVIYESTAAGGSPATVAWWKVDDVEATVKGLKSRGVVFEKKYDLPHTKRKGEIYFIKENMQAAWFRDPDGNILGFGNY